MTTEDQSRRLVLASGFARGELWEVAARSGWTLTYILPPGLAATTEFIWRIDPEHTFHYFECTDYPVEYCLVVGPQHDEMLMRVSAQLNFLDVDDVADAFDRAATEEEKALTTFALGLAAGDEPEKDIYERIHSAFDDPSSRVRLAAIDAAFVTGWEIFRSDLQRLSATDPDPVVSGTAANALADTSTPEPGEQGMV